MFLREYYAGACVPCFMIVNVTFSLLIKEWISDYKLRVGITNIEAIFDYLLLLI